MQQENRQTATDLEKDLIYQHSLRPEWGLAVFTYRCDDKRALQFEDGKVRLFKRGYLNLLEPVDAPADRTARTLARLGGESIEKSAIALPADALPFEAQLLLFHDLYPEGFRGLKWRRTKRSFDTPRRLKRHRNPSVKEAQDMLGETKLRAAVESRTFRQVHDGLIAMLSETNLVTARQLEPLKSVTDDAAEGLIRALFNVLHADEPSFAIRFERWLTELESACGTAPGWPLVTAPLALTQPNTFVCVRPTTFARQAQWMAPRLAAERGIGGLMYERWLQMVTNIEAALAEAGFAPRDYLDIYDFMLETLTPKKMDRARTLWAARPENDSAETSMSA